MIHILDFNDNIIDFINRDDGALLTANLKRDVEEKTETFDFTILSDRADNMRERNRVITQDHNGIYREFIIVHVEDDYNGTTDVQCNASYLEDLTTSKPLPPQTFEKMTTSQALTKALADTGWEVSDETEYGGVRSKSWTSYNTPYQVVGMLETAYEMVADYYIELGSHTVEHRYVSLKKPNSLFNGKEIAKGKDLTGLTRTVDTSEVRTALIALGPEDDKGNRETVIVKDDEAHAQFGLPGRYLWGVYEPESEDSSMTKQRLTTLATTELNKRKQLSVSYEISALDIHRYYDDVRVSLRDIVRVKDRDFNPPLYVEAEVISCEYDMILDDTVFKFGNVVEYEETALREEFNRRLDEIRKKLNDNISNVNTIVNDAIEGELEYYERKIIKSDTAPDNPVEDMLWYDTSNPNVAVLKRYHNGEWRNETAKNVEQLGGMTREQVLYNSLTNTFQNLNIQHSKLLEEVYQLLNSEYLVDTDIRNAVNNAVNNTTNIYDQIKSNLDTMTGDTATIGKLVDTQALFLKYRERLQDLYKAMRNAQIAVEDRLKLLQSQYTDEKFNDAMNEVAKTLPNGRWDSDKQQLFADIPNESDIENLRTSLQRYTDGQINDLNGVLGEEINSKINTTKSEISASISSVERKIDGIKVGGRNLLPSYNEKYLGQIYEKVTNTHNFTLSEWAKSIYRDDFIHSKLIPGETYTLTFDTEIIELSNKPSYVLNVGLILYDRNTLKTLVNAYEKIERVVGNKNHKSVTFTFEQGNYNILAYTNLSSQNGTSDGKPYESDTVRFTNLKLEKGNVATDWTPAPEDLKQDFINTAEENVENALKPITTRVITNETNISELDKQISLMAKSDDVAQKLRDVDGRLTPLETTVKSNKATLDILPTQIESKVSKQDYTLDKDEIVTRLNNAESERKQLNNQISDKVSLSEYESGINSVKSTNRNYLQSYYSPSQNIVNGVIKGAYSVIMDTNRTLNFYFYDRGTGANPTLEQDTDYILKIHESDINVRVGVFYNKGSNSIVYYTTDKIVRFNTKNYQDIRIILTPTSDNQFIGKVSLYKGTKELEWSPAPEDIEILGLTTDKYKQDIDTKLINMTTSISQNGREIQLKASQQDFNSSRKTLSQVISEISATTKGINLSYDENGNIQSYTMDRNGIQLRGDKVDITVNKDFNVMANRVNDKVGKDEVINRLNLSPEGLDIDVNKVGIRGGDSTNYIYLSQDKIEMAGTFQRTFRGNTQKDNVFMRAQGGFLRFRNNNQNRSLYYSDFGISTYIDGDSSEASGTLQFFDYTYSPTNSVRGVTLNSAGGAIALNSERNRIVLDANATVNIESETSSVYIRPMKNNRAGTNEFRFWTKLNDSVADTDGVLSYGTITELVEKAPASYSFGSGIRFDKSPKSRYIYATDKDGNIGTGDFYARNLLGDWWAKNNNLYALVDPKEGKLRITDYNGYNNGRPKYKDLQCDDIQANSVRVNTGQNFYIGVSTNELWVTNNLRYNGGNTGFKPVRASDFIKASSAEFKHDIKKWDYDALNVISNELQLYSYKYNDDEKQAIHHGPVIGDGYDIPVEFVFNSGVNTNEMLSWALRAIQQLHEKINTLEEQLNE